MTNLFQQYADISSILIPVVAGMNELVYKKYVPFGIYGIASLVHQIAIPKVKHLFPLCIRPNGKLHSFPSGHASSAWMGAVFSICREGFTIQ